MCGVWRRRDEPVRLDRPMYVTMLLDPNHTTKPYLSASRTSKQQLQSLDTRTHSTLLPQITYQTANMHRTYSMRQSRAPTASQIQNPPPPSSSTKAGRFFGKANIGTSCNHSFAHFSHCGHLYFFLAHSVSLHVSTVIRPRCHLRGAVTSDMSTLRYWI
jgi:hypothetical protein